MSELGFQLLSVQLQSPCTLFIAHWLELRPGFRRFRALDTRMSVGGIRIRQCRTGVKVNRMKVTRAR